MQLQTDVTPLAVQPTAHQDTLHRAAPEPGAIGDWRAVMAVAGEADDTYAYILNLGLSSCITYAAALENCLTLRLERACGAMQSPRLKCQRLILQVSHAPRLSTAFRQMPQLWRQVSSEVALCWMERVLALR